MLCDQCQEIFSKSRKVGYGIYYSWGHTKKTFKASRLARHHLYYLVWENRSYAQQHNACDENFPGQCSYSFKTLGQNAALHGAELRLLMPSDSEHKESLATGRGIAIECFTRATIDEHEHTPNQASKMANSQFVDVLFLNFSSPGLKTMLPLEIFKGTFAIPSGAKLIAIFLENQLEGLAQAKLEEQLWTSTTEALHLQLPGSIIASRTTRNAVLSLKIKISTPVDCSTWVHQIRQHYRSIRQALFPTVSHMRPLVIDGVERWNTLWLLNPCPSMRRKYQPRSFRKHLKMQSRLQGVLASNIFGLIACALCKMMLTTGPESLLLWGKSMVSQRAR